MAISALINRHLFTTRVFDSGALTVLASVIHQFGEPGRYHVTIRHGDTVVGTTPFEVSADSTATQLNLDLAVLGAAPGSRAAFTRTARGPRGARKGAGQAGEAGEKDCGCHGGGAAGAHASGASASASAAGVPTVSPKGYVQFFGARLRRCLEGRLRDEGGSPLVGPGPRLPHQGCRPHRRPAGDRAAPASRPRDHGAALLPRPADPTAQALEARRRRQALSGAGVDGSARSRADRRPRQPRAKPSPRS